MDSNVALNIANLDGNVELYGSIDNEGAKVLDLLKKTKTINMISLDNVMTSTKNRLVAQNTNKFADGIMKLYMIVIHH